MRCIFRIFNFQVLLFGRYCKWDLKWKACKKTNELQHSVYIWYVPSILTDRYRGFHEKGTHSYMCPQG